MLRVRSFSAAWLRKGVLCFQKPSRFSAQSVNSLLQPLDKQVVPAKLRASLPYLGRTDHLHGFAIVGCFGGIAAASAFAYSLFNHEVISVSQEGEAPAKRHIVEWDEELSPVFVWVRRLWAPLLMAITIAMGWHYPLSLCINLLFLFWSTKPTPSSIYMWVEQKRLQAAARAHGLGRLKAQLSNATLMTHVEVKDYGLACIAQVSSLSQKMLVIGVLGNWWVFSSCSSSISGFNFGSWFPISTDDQW